MNIFNTVVSILFVFTSTISNSQDINFEDLNRAGPGLVKFATISGLASDADSYTKSFTDTDSSRREASRQSSSSYSSSSSGSSSSSSSSGSIGGWKLLKKYEGGFSKFGMDRARTVYVVKCGSGREHEIYVGNNGKWGTGGSGLSNNSATSFEQAASEACR